MRHLLFRLLVCSLAGAFWSGCRTPGFRAWDKPNPRAVERFEVGVRAEESGDAELAEQSYRESIRISPHFVRAHRKFQNILAARCRRIELFKSYRQSLDENPDHPVWLYLYGRLLRDPQEREAMFRRSRRSSAEFEFSHYGLGYNDEVGGRFDEALDHYDAALAISPRDPLFLARVGSCLRQANRLAEAAIAFREALKSDPRNQGARLGLALVHRDERETGLMFERLHEALAVAPTSPSVHALVRELSRSFGTRSDHLRMAELLEVAAGKSGENDQLLYSIGVLCELLGRPAASALSLSRAAGRFRNPAATARVLRRVLFALGSYDDGWKQYARKLPSEILEDPRNEIASKYVELRQAIADLPAEPNPKQLSFLGRTLADLGWLEEARMVYTRALLGSSDFEPARVGLERVGQHLRFVRRLRRYATAIYKGFTRRRSAPSLDEFAAEIVTAAREELSIVPGEFGFVSYSPLGRVWMSTRDPGSVIARHFEQFNQHVVIGQRIGGPPEISIVTMLSLRRGLTTNPLGVEITLDEVIQAETNLPSYQVHRGSRLAGIALVDTVLLDLDAIWSWAAGSVEAASRWAAAPRWVRESDGLLARTSTERLSVSETLCLAERLAFDAGLEALPLDEVFGLHLAHVRWHEYGHILDASRFIPLRSHLFRALSLFIGQGLSAFAVESFLEGDAECVALAESADPRFAIAMTVGNLESSGPGDVHARGYREVIERMVERIDTNRKSFPQIDFGKNILQQFHRVPPERIRDLAFDVARDRFDLKR